MTHCLPLPAHLTHGVFRFFSGTIKINRIHYSIRIHKVGLKEFYIEQLSRERSSFLELLPLF